MYIYNHMQRHIINNKQKVMQAAEVSQYDDDDENYPSTAYADYWGLYTHIVL